MRFPVEIITMIIENVRRSHPPGVFFANQFREEEQTLARLARVSHTFHREATKALLSIATIWVCERGQSSIDKPYDDADEWKRLYGRRRGVDSDDPDAPDDPPPKEPRPMRFENVFKKLQDLNQNSSLIERHVHQVYISVNTPDYKVLEQILPQLGIFLQHATSLQHLHIQTGPQSEIDVVRQLTAEIAHVTLPRVQSIKIYFHGGMHRWDLPDQEQEEETYDALMSFISLNPSLVHVDLKGIKTWPDVPDTPAGTLLPQLKKFKGSMCLMEAIRLDELEEVWIGWEESEQSDVWGINVLNLNAGTRYEHLRTLSFDLSGPFTRLMNLFDLLQCRHDFPNLELLSGCKLTFPLPEQRLHDERQTFWSKFPKLKTIVAVYSGFDTPFEAPKIHTHKPEINLNFHFIMRHIFPRLEVLELVEAYHDSPRDDTSYSLSFQCYRYANNPHILPGEWDYTVNRFGRPRVIETRYEACRFSDLGIAEIFGSCALDKRDRNDFRSSLGVSKVDVWSLIEQDKDRKAATKEYFADKRWAMW
ncbi:hypothetical protein SISSUDRAFT_366146 [Sistotremastrum suecicum HHB10207 ss-3]|uniref:Uncharacterized protein n=1 Tax=Sistotremastrum suecicum HHB10207 ss-3 TaxID=1314776 RepID=A0A165Z3D6_9AGAM|nr:hypothetical protein SISSUDRAFT_366146 [Sistotremastrum suecicum HHB10207 ss-3]